MIKKIKEKFGKVWIRMNNTEEVEETKEVEEMGFFEKHKTGFILGGLGAIAAGVIGFILTKSRIDDCDFEEDDEFFDDVESTDE